MNGLSSQFPSPVIAIVGGGFTGATVALHLARRLPPQAARILVIEPRPQLGQGLAYSTRDPSHRINVPASRMTVDCADKGGFQSWIDSSGVTLSPGTRAQGALFPQRGLVADYVTAQLQPYLDSGQVRHVQAHATAARPGYVLTLDHGETLRADHVVIATSHPLPGVPGAFAALADDPRVVTDPSDDAAITRLAGMAGPILIVGTGLTSADVIASLTRQGYGGQITALSRRGLRSRGHAAGCPETRANFAEFPERTALGVLRRIRAAVRADAQHGLPWQAALDQVRIDGPAIWAALPLAERERLVQRLRVWWDVHRFRIAPQVEAVLDDLIEKGRLSIIAGHLRSAEATPEGIAVTWRTTRTQDRQRQVFAAVVLTTGPAHGAVIGSNPLLSSLAQQGLIAQDVLGLGLDVTQICHAVGNSGQITPNLWVAGPLARGHIGELMGIPEVTTHAQAVAAQVAHALLVPAAADAVATLAAKVISVSKS